jgi:5-methylcytosine-specific restriction endonuclease McrA
MSGKRSNYNRPYNDQNPIIDMTSPGMRLSPGIRFRRHQSERTNADRLLLIMRLTIELMADQHNECYWCGTVMWHPRRLDTMPIESQDGDNRATFDHKILFSEGGKDTKENGVAACKNCNNHRGDMPFEEYEQWPPGI